jgi:predicted dehydrogenase
MDILGVGIIGFGRIGAEHERWIRQAKGVRVVAVADVTAARREMASARGLAVYQSVDDLLNDARVGAVLVSTPTAMHHQQAMAALRADKHVMVEKPMALDLPQAQEMMREAHRRNKTLSVFHNRRWDVDFLTIDKHVRSGVFGRVFNVQSRLGQWASCVGPAATEFRPGWRNESAYGGGGLYDWGSHFVDQLWRLMWPNRPVRLFAQLRGNVWTNDCDDLARVCIDFEDGAACLVEINTTTRFAPPRWHVDGTLGSGQSPASADYDTRRWAELDFIPAAGSPARLAMADEGINEPIIWEQFAAATRGECEPAVTAHSVLPTMQLLDAARESARRGVVVEINGDSWAV